MPDQFSNIASISVTESAANTLTFKKLETGVSFMEKVAWLISRIEYHVPLTNAATFNSADDTLHMAITTSNAITAINDLANPSVVDFNQFTRIDIGTAASGFFMTRPIVRSFYDIAGGGLIVPPNPLYLGAQGSGLNAATTVTVRIYYTVIELKTEQYWELVEARRIIAS